MSQIKHPKGVFATQKPLRDEKYRRYISTLECRVCGKTPCQAAHIGHSSIGMKGGDDLCEPLCPEHHRDFDTAPEGKEKWWMRNVEIPEAVRRYKRWSQLNG